LVGLELRGRLLNQRFLIFLKFNEKLIPVSVFVGWVFLFMVEYFMFSELKRRKEVMVIEFKRSKVYKKILEYQRFFNLVAFFLSVISILVGVMSIVIGVHAIKLTKKTDKVVNATERKITKSLSALGKVALLSTNLSTFELRLHLKEEFYNQDVLDKLRFDFNLSRYTADNPYFSITEKSNNKNKDVFISFFEKGPGP
jgi:hypothetical protein